MREPSEVDLVVRDRQRSQDLLMFYDEFAELQSSCAFFCDAVAALLKWRWRLMTIRLRAFGLIAIA